MVKYTKQNAVVARRVQLLGHRLND